MKIFKIKYLMRLQDLMKMKSHQMRIRREFNQEFKRVTAIAVESEKEGIPGLPLFTMITFC